MRTADLLRFDFQVLNRHRFRALMMLIAMSIGVAAVNLLTGLGEGAKAFVLGEFSMLGKNTLIMLPGKKETSGGMPPMMGAAPRDITLQDAEAMRRLSGVVQIAPLIVGMSEVSYGSRNREVMIAGTTASYFSIRQLSIRQGTALPEVPSDVASPVCVIGWKVKQEIFGERPALGQWLKAGDRRFRVVGIMDAKGQALGMDMNDLMLIPVASAQALFNQEGLFRVMIEVQSADMVKKTKQRVIDTMKLRHEGDEDVTVITQDSILAAFNKILDTMTLAVGGIGAISLLVAGILIMNVTLIAVTQRTKEIGLLKAIGATDRDVLQIFLTEATLMAVLGALLGVILSETALFIGRVIFPDIGFHTPPWAMVMSVVIAIVTSVLFAWGPSRRAARMEPVNALQGRN
ncbi:MAG: FtsX-like permease family protein [Gammaproteobacteria bacterium]|nr:FtsX-like permease family protein [Gammaproteobacteria bacterium]